MKRFVPVSLVLCWALGAAAQPQATLEGRVLSATQQPVVGAHVFLEGTSYADLTDSLGAFRIQAPPGAYRLVVQHVSYVLWSQPVTLHPGRQEVFPVLEEATYVLGELVVSERRPSPNRQVLFTMSRLPVEVRNQPQTVSVVDARLLAQQEALTLHDAIKNIPGAYSWATFGNSNSTFGARGFRGITYLKNGVEVSTSMPAIEGAESVQVIKGASAIVFGLVSPGGAINLETKKPRFTPGGQVSLQVGSFDLYRAQFDTWGPLNSAATVAYRLNGVLLSSGSYRKYVSQRRTYLNPSLAWRLRPTTSLVLEYDYLLDNHTPDNGTILYNNEIYDLPFDQFLGFRTDNQRIESHQFSATLTHQLHGPLFLRAVASYAWEANDIQRPGNNANVIRGTSLLVRALTRSESDYVNSLFQVDLLGQQVRTGVLTHDFQLGLDYRQRRTEQLRYGSVVIDTVDVRSGDIPNDVSLPALRRDRLGQEFEQIVGVAAQDVVTVGAFKLLLGLRYTMVQSEGETYYYSREETVLSPYTRKHGWTPSFGAIYRVRPNIGLFATYTNTFQPTSYRGADGEELGNQVTDQIEFGIRSEWLEDRLTVNLALYQIYDKNQIVPAVAQDENGVWRELGYYERSGDYRNRGLELDVRALLPSGFELTAGYSYIDAKYLKSDKYRENAVPLNTPTHSGNAWLYYTVPQGRLRGVSVGLGVFYTGERWGNDQVKRPWHGIDPTQPVHKLPAYTEVNLAVRYQTGPIALRFGVNNLLDERSYLSYRNYYINPIEPRRYSFSLSYAF
ncbi:TonB-dependent receptor [Rhodothermus marinus]|uniref:TonB-dependent siderophore receptor n=1 Tax=Rhodothermus marinus (strain ATCC 43812 / DSM 4252 / R-10) TaxID=518766 RepID=D0MH65_RHOM4|nr:TonB-dependent receptor [Rhodothermus marinus]ACY49654.1 TonB-dependent siderophore receptor [Rhodothermus marinus DSM 4252]